MARTMVYREKGGDSVPFLRGILTRSLIKTGLSFEDAYGLAQTVRSELKDVSSISTNALTLRVASHLEAQFGPEYSAIFLSIPEESSEIIVHTPTRSAPFSIAVMVHSLVACAISTTAAMAAAQRIHEGLRDAGRLEIDIDELCGLIYHNLRVHGSQKQADRFLSWRQFQDSGYPLILLIGGVTGSGKSTIATELNYRLDIARTQSTDMIREIIRSYITLEVAPTLQYSSFEAWRGLPTLKSEASRNSDNAVVEGFLSQFSVVKPALDAAIARAVQEKEHLILEGVHVVPPELDLDSASQTSIVLPVMVATKEKKVLRSRLKRRGREKTQRGAQRYVDHVDEIWELQSHLLSAADASGISIIQNVDIEQTIQELLAELSRLIVNRFPPDPASMPWNT